MALYGPATIGPNVALQSPVKSPGILMRTLISCVLAACVLAACASQPAAPPVTKQVKVDGSNVAEAQAAGYKSVNENGKTLYCRKEQMTGSHVRTRTSCLTEQEWKQAAEQGRAAMQDMSRRVPPPQGK